MVIIIIIIELIIILSSGTEWVQIETLNCETNRVRRRAENATASIAFLFPSDYTSGTKPARNLLMRG